MALIGQHQQTSFANPQNGQSPMDADTVRGNDNAVTAKHNSHDSDNTIHVQTGLLASRPAASTVGAMYLDENGRFYRDTGTTWVELPYARLDASGTNAFANNVTVGGTLGVTGVMTLLNNLNVSGTVTAAGFTGPTVVPASNVSSGTFSSGNYVFPANLTVTSVFNSGAATVSSLTTGGTVSGATVLATNGQMRGVRTTQTGSGGTVSFTSANHIRHTMTGNGTITLSGGSAGGVYTLEVLQDGTGGRTVTWSGAVWAGGVIPTTTTTANRKDVYTFFFDGSNYLGVQFGANFASTA